MRKGSLAIVFFLSAAAHATGLSCGLEVRPAGRELFQTRPREIVSTTFRITNITNTRYEFIGNVELPEAWGLITEDFPFDLGPNETTTKPISFFVPETTPPGRYKITYLVKARKYPVIRDFYTIDVVVLPYSKLEVRLLRAPQYITAGQDYRVSFSVTNKSNSENTVSIKINSSKNIPFTVDAGAFKLAPGQSKTVAVNVKPDAKIAKTLKHRLQLTAQIVRDGKSKTQARAAHSVEIIPKAAVEQSLRTIVAQDIIRQLSGKEEQTKLHRAQTRVPKHASLRPEPRLHKRSQKYLRFALEKPLEKPEIKDKSTTRRPLPPSKDYLKKKDC